MGRRQFSKEDVDRIRTILSKRPRTKATRDKLRNIGFYISDFSGASPFTVADFDRLVVRKEIVVSASPIVHRSKAPVTSPKPPSAAFADRNVEGAREKFRPTTIKHLVVGESAPRGGTFFYFANSLLFRQTRTAFYEVFGKVCGDGQQFLRYFQDKQFFLDDLCSVPVNGMDGVERVRERAAGIKPLAKRIADANPETVVVAMKAIVPEVREACHLADVSPKLVELPFPRPKHQAQFVARLVNFLRTLQNSAMP